MHDASPRSLGSCSGCGSLSLSGQWLQAFGVAICNSCRQDEELITKVCRPTDKPMHCSVLLAGVIPKAHKRCSTYT